ncbi:hypothetical protein [Hyphomicrobium sp.]|jgi:hypothetical protein|uniref:hypothetical protein n=1 Tax=Hyphomicrobium sp. TaxID=82 RepID=UPI0035662004
MQDFWWQLQDVNSFTVYTALAFAGIVCLFIHEIVGSPMLAWLSVPLLAAGGVVAPTLLGQQMITLSYDRTVNTVSATALGTLSALMLILLGNWLWTLLVEYRVSRTKLVAIPTRQPRIRR